MENVKPITRIVSQEPKPVNINSDNTPISREVNNNTWLMRYNNMQKPQGYNNGRRLLKKLSINEWKEKSGISSDNRAPLFIESTYFYNSVNRQNMFVTFPRLRYCDLIKEKISYFSLYYQDQTKVHSLFTLLRKEGFNLVTKFFDSTIDNGESIIPDLVIALMHEIYSEEPPVSNIILMASDSLLIPYIQHFRSINVKFTLAIAPTQVVSNHYLNQFDYIIDVVEFMQYANCIRESVNHGV